MNLDLHQNGMLDCVGQMWTWVTAAENIVAGPFCTVASQYHVPGSVATQSHTPGTVANQHHAPGSVSAQTC